MKYDKYGQAYTTENEIFELLYKNPELDLSLFSVVDQPAVYNHSNDKTYAGFPFVQSYVPINYKEDVPIELFDWGQQQNWYMPTEYKTLDIAQWILDQCTTEEELQRVGEELLKFQELEMFPMLRYCKYLVDTMRKNNVVWGVGRGSSIASFVLFLLGVHRINSLYYDLSIDEFLK